MSRRRLPVAGLGGMFSLAARVPIFSGYYTTPAVEGKGRADCVSAARGPPLGSREERGLSGDFRLGVFLGDTAGEKALSPCASMGFWDCGSEEGVFFVRCRPGSGLSPLRARAGAALVFFWADAHEGQGRGFLERKPPKELLRSLRSASLQLQLLSGVFPRFRQGAQGGQVLLIPVGVLQHPLLIQLDPQQPLALL